MCLQHNAGAMKSFGIVGAPQTKEWPLNLRSLFLCRKRIGSESIVLFTFKFTTKLAKRHTDKKLKLGELDV